MTALPFRRPPPGVRGRVQLAFAIVVIASACSLGGGVPSEAPQAPAGRGPDPLAGQGDGASQAGFDYQVVEPSGPLRSGPTNATVLARPVFVDVTEQAGLGFVHHLRESGLLDFGAGALTLDYNRDGYDDLYVTDSNGPNALYSNNGDGTFTDVATSAGVDDPEGWANGGCSADYDNDGDTDLFVTNLGPSRLFRNNSDGTFTDVASGILENLNKADRSMGCAWGDYDGDGFVDLIIVSHMLLPEPDGSATTAFAVTLSRLALYHNNGGDTFADVTSLLGDISGPVMPPPVGNVWGAGFQPGWLDYDNDGDLDLYVVNDFGAMVQPNVLWRNDGPAPGAEWVFTDVSANSGANVPMYGMALAVGDPNLDGQLDMFMTNIGSNVLLTNNGDGDGFTNTTDAAGVGVGSIGQEYRVAWGAVFFDYDNDGDEDLYVVSGHLSETDQFPNPAQQPNVLLRNDGGVFTDVSKGSGVDDPGVGRGGVFLDFDVDGCLDLFIVNYGQGARLFRNACDSGNSWLAVEARGVRSNRDGIGARITVTAGGITQIREVSAGSSQMGQNMLAAHFGLGKATRAEFVLVKWPSGGVQTLAGVPVNQRLIITEQE